MGHLTTLMRQYADYDLWASTALIGRLKEEPGAVLDRPAPSSFPTLRATLMHVRDAQRTWHERLFGGPPPDPGEGIGGVIEVSGAMAARVRRTSEEDLLAMVGYARADGSMYRQPRWELLLHCINHGTHHRGQAVAQMRALGLDRIPRTDLVAFQRLAGA